MLLRFVELIEHVFRMEGGQNTLYAPAQFNLPQMNASEAGTPRKQHTFEKGPLDFFFVGMKYLSLFPVNFYELAFVVISLTDVWIFILLIRNS